MIIPVKAEKYTGYRISPEEPISGVYWRKQDATGRVQYRIGHFMRRSSDGKFVYCIQPMADINNNYVYNIARQDYELVTNLSLEQYRRIILLAYYGYEYENHTESKWYAVTQLLIWRTTDPDGNFNFTNGLNGSINYDLYTEEIAELERLVEQHKKIPKFNQKEITIPLGQSITLNDENGVLSNFKITNQNNVNASINGNTLNITATGIGTANITLSKIDTKYASAPIVYFNDHSQDVISVGSYDPMSWNLKINVIGGRVEITKKDKETGEIIPQGAGLLSDATYGIYNATTEELITSITTNKNAYAISDYLPSLGNFYLQEITPSLGYKLDSQKYYFTIDENNLLVHKDVYEEVIKKEVNIIKVYANGNTGILTPEPNITFDIYFKDTKEYYKSITTGVDGFASIKLPYGVWIFKQSNSSLNYEKVEDFEVEILDENGKIFKYLSNAEIKAKLKIIKIDADSKKVIIREGLKFKIKNLETGEYIKQTITYPTAQIIEIFEMDKNGVIITPFPLSSGKYALEELEDQKIEGYIWNSEPLIFEIGENSELILDEQYGTLLELKFPNKQVKGELIVNKLGEEIIIEDGSFRYEEIKLDGVYYELYANSDIYSQDGSLIYKDKSLVKSFYTKDGFYKLTDIYLGSYCLVEVASVENHIVDKSRHCFNLKYEDQYTETITYTLNLKNYLKKGDFEFTKTDVAGNPLPNTTITIYTNNDNEERKLIFKGKTSSTGNIIIKGLFTGKFILYESEAPDGFILNPDPMYFEIKENGEIIKATMTNEAIVKVPNTGIKDSKFVDILGIFLILLGIGYFIYDKKNKKK